MLSQPGAPRHFLSSLLIFLKKYIVWLFRSDYEGVGGKTVCSPWHWGSTGWGWRSGNLSEEEEKWSGCDRGREECSDKRVSMNVNFISARDDKREHHQSRMEREVTRGGQLRTWGWEVGLMGPETCVTKDWLALGWRKDRGFNAEFFMGAWISLKSNTVGLEAMPHFAIA